MKLAPPQRQPGFTLVELTVVLVVVALLSGGLMLTLSAQRSSAELADAQRQLDSAKEILLGFAMANGRLPCPAKATLPNTDTNAGIEDCSTSHGVLPWVTLGLPETDPWGQRLTYFVSNKFTTVGFTLNTGNSDDAGGLANIKNRAGNKVAIDLAAVVVSHGRHSSGGYQANGGKVAGAINEEAENADADQDFVANTPTPDFDDLLTWISPSLLKARLVAAGKLP